MEENEQYLNPYQKEINNMQLDFKKKPKEVKQAPPPPKPQPIPQPQPKPQPKPIDYTKIIGGGDFFDTQVGQQAKGFLDDFFGDEVVEDVVDDFFNQKKTILRKNNGTSEMIG